MIEDKTKRLEKIDTGLVLYKKNLAMKEPDGKPIPPAKSKPACGPTNPLESCWKLHDKFPNKKSGYYWL